MWINRKVVTQFEERNKSRIINRAGWRSEAPRCQIGSSDRNPSMSSWRPEGGQRVRRRVEGSESGSREIGWCRSLGKPEGISEGLQEETELHRRRGNLGLLGQKRRQQEEGGLVYGNLRENSRDDGERRERNPKEVRPRDGERVQSPSVRVGGLCTLKWKKIVEGGSEEVHRRSSASNDQLKNDGVLPRMIS